MGFPGVSLLLDIAFLGQDCVFLEDCAFKFDNRLLALSEADLKLTDLHFVVASLAFHLVLVLALQTCHLICDVSLELGHQILHHLLVSGELISVQVFGGQHLIIVLILVGLSFIRVPVLVGQQLSIVLVQVGLSLIGVPLILSFNLLDMLLTLS